MDRDGSRNTSRLDTIVLAYDDALRQGRIPRQVALDWSDMDGDELAELQALQGCLRRLERAWPRGQTSSEDLTWHTEAVHLAAALQDLTCEDQPRPAPPVTTIEGLKQAVIESGLPGAEDLDAWLAGLPPDQRPGTMPELAYEMVQRAILSRRQALVLCRGDLGTLVLGDYLVLEELGRGGLGIVYKALDRRRECHVALKTLYQTDQKAISRLKQEFRAVSNLVHPNLVVPDELRYVEDHWFFTMELVDGVHFTRYVRCDPEVGPHNDGNLVVIGPLDSLRQLERLRHGLRELATGLHALHRAGKLHRDVKPSNAIVTAEGRAVLVDFGMVVAKASERADRPLTHRPAGTVPYMSPEQSEGKPLTEASDWYSVGVMLYESLVGQLPFPGDSDEILEAKQGGPPSLLAEAAHTVFADLADLCRQLLQPDPNDRPSSQEILRRLGCKPEEKIDGKKTHSTEMTSLFVGRERELAELRQAVADVRTGQPVNVYAHGPSGIGKTALVTHFLEHVDSEENTLVLRGRCYERESVPYKALDDIVDALSLHLQALPAASAHDLLPEELGCLVRIFPTFKPLWRLRGRNHGESIPPERREVRRRAVRALRELLGRLARHQLTVLFVDDLQWGDTDSAVMLTELFQVADSPPVVFIGSYRSADRRTSRCLEILLETQASLKAHEDRREIEVRPLSSEESRLMAASLMKCGGEGLGSREVHVSRESGGNPYFLLELAKQTPQEGFQAGVASQPLPVDLEGILLRRVNQLPPEARQLLNVFAVAGHSLRMEMACRVIEWTLDPRIDALLRSEQLIRTAGGGQPGAVETYHDRVRETITRHLSQADTQDYHARIADVLEASSEVDPEVLFVHFEAAGDNGKAATYALQAADRAADATAFDRAAHLYQFVLGLSAFDVIGESNLRRKLADALAGAGQGAEAAEHYLAAARLVEGTETVELNRLAADRLLRTGRFEEYQQGRRVMAETLSAVGLREPRSPRQVIFMILVDALRLKLRGGRCEERGESDIPSEDLVRVDTCESAGWTFCMADGLAGMALFLRHARLARSIGEPGRIAMGQAMHGCLFAIFKHRHTPASRRLCDTAQSLARRNPNRYWTGVVRYVRGTFESFVGNWRQSLALSEEAERILRQTRTGIHFEISMVTIDIIHSLFFLGEIKRLSRLVPEVIHEADQRGDLFDCIALRSYFGNIVWLAADQAEEARRQAQYVLPGWPRSEFLLQHALEVIGSASIDLYEGDGPQALERLAEAWSHLKRRGELRHPLLRYVTFHLRARAALASLGCGQNDQRLLRQAERDAKKLFPRQSSWAPSVRHLVRAGVAAVRGEKEQAVQELEFAVHECDTWEMALYSAAAKRRLGELIGGQRGEELILAGTEFMTDQGVVRPDRMTRMLSPGFE